MKQSVRIAARSPQRHQPSSVAHQSSGAPSCDNCSRSYVPSKRRCKGRAFVTQICRSDRTHPPETRALSRSHHCVLFHQHYHNFSRSHFRPCAAPTRSSHNSSSTVGWKPLTLGTQTSNFAVQLILKSCFLKSTFRVCQGAARSGRMWSNGRRSDFSLQHPQSVSGCRWTSEDHRASGFGVDGRPCDSRVVCALQAVLKQNHNGQFANARKRLTSKTR